ncbi:MAG: hypothetical protein ACRDTR_17065, partial [Rubrobacter sp.]
MAPEATSVALNTVEVRLASGILALNRFMMTLQNKRMPVVEIELEGDTAVTRIRLGLECPEETARRYAVLLENMEDVEELRFAGSRPEGRTGSSVDYAGRRFRSTENSASGEVGPETVFSYEQEGNVVSATYKGGDVRFGTLVATADGEGNLDARYQHVNAAGVLMTGECRTTPEALSDGRLRLHEEWR